MTTSITWTGTLTAISSVSHGGVSLGTATMLRRETIFTPDGQPRQVPLISGNHLRGVLRRMGEELLRDTLGYEGQIPLPAAHVLRGGGALAKTGKEPLSGAPLARLRALVPQIGVFGGAVGGTIISGALDVGKVVPHIAETARITGVDSPVSAFRATQIEEYSRRADSDDHDFADVVTASDARLVFDKDGKPSVVGGSPMRFKVETFLAGTVFSTWITLKRPTALELAFFTDVLATYSRDARLGGRAAIGHGKVQADFVSDRDADAGLDWRAELTGRRNEVLEVLQGLA